MPLVKTCRLILTCDCCRMSIRPTSDRPLYRFAAKLTEVPEEPFIPPVETRDNYAFVAETALVVVVDGEARTPEELEAPKVYDLSEEKLPEEERAPAKIIETLLLKRVKPIGLHPPIIEALGRFMTSLGSSWTTESLIDIADVGTDFYTFTTAVPAENLTLTLAGDTHQVAASALVAAGLRMAVCETTRLSDYRPLIDALQNDPARVQALIAREQKLAVESASGSWLQLPPGLEDFTFEE